MRSQSLYFLELSRISGKALRLYWPTARSLGMNFLLRNLESEVEEAALTAGEALVEAEAVQQPSEVDKGLWVAQVEGYEVEARLTPTRVLEGTCECAAFRKGGMCGHIIAVLLVLRRQQQEQQTQKKQQRRGAQKPKRLTTSIVLDHVEREELVDFVREYARRNRNFAIALKARFASAVEALDSREKYEQLIETTISAVRKPDRRISLRGSQRLLRVLEELKQQMVQAAERAAFVEASVIARLIIEKISPLLPKAGEKRYELRQFIRDAFQQLHRLLEKPVAPTLLNELWNYGLEAHKKRIYRSQEIDLLFLKWLLELARDTEQLNTLLSAVEAHMEVYQTEERPLAPLLLLRVSALEKAGREPEARQLMERNLAQPNVLEYAIRQAQQRKQGPRVKALAQTGLKLDPPEGTRAWLEQLLLDLAVGEGDTPNIRKYALRRFLDTLDLKYYRQARQFTPEGERPEQLSELLSQLKALPYSSKLRDTQAQLLAAEKEWALLLAYAQEVQSLDLLALIDQPLLQQHPEELYSLYDELLREYARHHLGRQTARRIRQALQRLLDIGAADLAHRLMEEFRREYGERHSLMEELQELGE